jgi:hypothetical protein
MDRACSPSTATPAHRPGSALECRSLPLTSSTPRSRIQRCASAGPSRPSTAGSVSSGSGQWHPSESRVWCSSPPDVEAKTDHGYNLALDSISVRARVQYDTFQVGASQKTPLAPGVDALLQSWRNALRQLHAGYSRLVASNELYVDADTAAWEHTLPTKRNRAASAHAGSSCSQNSALQNHAIHIPYQRPETADHSNPRAESTHQPVCCALDNACTITNVTDTPSLALMFVSLTASFLQWAMTPQKHDHPRQSRTGVNCIIKAT